MTQPGNETAGLLGLLHGGQGQRVPAGVVGRQRAVVPQ